MKTIKESNIVRLANGGIGVDHEDVKRGDIVRTHSEHRDGSETMCGVYKVGNAAVGGGSLKRLTRLGSRPVAECK